jgi:hypothetical protein
LKAKSKAAKATEFESGPRFARCASCNAYDVATTASV